MNRIILLISCMSLLFGIVSCVKILDPEATTIEGADNIPREIALKYMVDNFKYCCNSGDDISEFRLPGGQQFKPGTTTCEFSNSTVSLDGMELTKISGSPGWGKGKIIGKVVIDYKNLKVGGFGPVNDHGYAYGLLVVDARVNPKTMQAYKGINSFGGFSGFAFFNSFDIGDKMIHAFCSIVLGKDTPLKKVGAALDALGVMVEGVPSSSVSR
ncbi:MAG: hypothetical protein HW380_3001 [Magnetococcales bacterium]|nr:hypothetical protein [Magnetococcales bacterium]HIJ82728.1 hypothetical protein [Magnetococcales bacterium]